MPDLHRLRLAVDVIYEGPQLSPSAAHRVAQNLSTHAHVLAFENIKNIAVQYAPMDERVIYAHHHESPGGSFCQVRNGCYQQAQDGHSQDNL